ncbi:hypothetical protein [Tepidibacillus fermentans]|nr:hypothetical protein [Tepidibacillus fermentans]
MGDKKDNMEDLLMTYSNHNTDKRQYKHPISVVQEVGALDGVNSNAI